MYDNMEFIAYAANRSAQLAQQFREHEEYSKDYGRRLLFCQ
jgi:hypothetical protein